MKIAEIDETYEGGRPEWLVVYADGDWVLIRRERNIWGDERRTVQDVGIDVQRRNLRALIEALEEAEMKGTIRESDPYEAGYRDGRNSALADVALALEEAEDDAAALAAVRKMVSDDGERDGG